MAELPVDTITMEQATRNITPTLRTTSPSPNASPSIARHAPPPIERSISQASYASVSSRRSSSCHSDATSRRRGFARPQATSFADSARNRESVMSLGTIAHLQYYFARTGLLDGKGAQLLSESATKDAQKVAATDASGLFLSSTPISDNDSTYSSMRSSPEVAYANDADRLSESLMGLSTQSPEAYEYAEESDYVLLPPTVSTYNQRVKPLPRLPAVDELRGDLRHALAEASKALHDAQSQSETKIPEQSEQDTKPENATSDGTSESPATRTSSQGWHEIQGMHLLDVMTLAIRAAKIYYTAHEQPARLMAIKSERKIRQELLAVMDALRKLANRYFAGGLKEDERLMMQNWVTGVEDLLAQEQERERLEKQERNGWEWAHGDWAGREREREWHLLHSFDTSMQALPPWETVSDPSMLPTPFLKELQNGVRLIQLHNEMVSKSKRPYGHITKSHTDTAKPYRCAENLRYWVKAVELRWEMVLRIDVMAVVYGKDQQAWKTFEEEILKWCGQVRKEFTAEREEGGQIGG
ncbi:MAG: hypothetical protein M1817_002162 [Caeruleum heppii]|nr:MAG: hypothetical protein M1817_002162 [Caeruleum heppii]